jgi:hypothetical protein
MWELTGISSHVYKKTSYWPRYRLDLLHTLLV